VARASRSFDRAAPFYDETRVLPRSAAAAVTALLAGELSGRGPCLEIGVGTGRIALPLAAEGVPMVGVDLSRPMMTVLVDKAGGRPPFPLLQADAVALPFPDDRFAAAVASHVFHLIPAWRDALTELARVLRRRGVILSSRGGGSGGGGRFGRGEGAQVIRAVRARLREEAGPAAGHPGVEHGRDDVEAALRDLGCAERELPGVALHRTMTVGALVDGLESGHWSWTWSVPEEVLHAAAERTRVWARDAFGPLDTRLDVETEVRWRAFDLP